MKTLFVVLMVAQLANAQTKWSDGVVVLKDSHILTGKFSISHDVLLNQDKDQVAVFPSHKVSSIRFYDASLNINRHFVSLSSQSNFFRTSYFYEVVVWGNTSVVRRKHQLVNYQSKNDEAENFDYFILLNKELVPMKKFRSKVYPKLLAGSSYLSDRVAAQNLNPNLAGDAIRIVQLSNKDIYDTSIAGL